LGERLVACGVTRPASEYRWLAGVALIICAASGAAIIAGHSVGVPVGEIYWGYGRATFLLGSVALLLAGVSVTFFALLCRSRGALDDCRTFAAERFGSADRALGTLGPILLVPLLMGAFGTFKQILPLVAPFTWDDTWAEIGRLLFLGYRPWQITHALFGSPAATMIINQIYGAWVPLLFIAVLAFSIVAPLYLRARFFVTFAAAWLLLGVVGAFAFSSAGPCFAGLVGAQSAPDFEPLMARLRSIDAAGYPIGALRWQQMLWRGYSEHHYGFALGISAMPSMHNSISFLYALCASGARAAVRIGAYLFAAVILIGSVHLGWHYIADGLFAWAGTAAIWWGAGVYLRWCGYVPEELSDAPHSTGEHAEPERPAEPVPA
jgi:hypothetical protein